MAQPPPCHFFSIGQCKHGDRCRFSHDIIPSDPDAAKAALRAKMAKLKAELQVLKSTPQSESASFSEGVVPSRTETAQKVPLPAPLAASALPKLAIQAVISPDTRSPAAKAAAPASTLVKAAVPSAALANIPTSAPVNTGKAVCSSVAASAKAPAAVATKSTAASLQIRSLDEILAEKRAKQAVESGAATPAVAASAAANAATASTAATAATARRGTTDVAAKRQRIDAVSNKAPVGAPESTVATAVKQAAPALPPAPAQQLSKADELDDAALLDFDEDLETAGEYTEADFDKELLDMEADVAISS